jgi:hypothetical protein
VKVGFASDIGTAMLFIQQIPEVKALVQVGKPAAILLSQEFDKDVLNPLKYRYDSERDVLLACVAGDYRGKIKTSSLTYWLSPF